MQRTSFPRRRLFRLKVSKRAVRRSSAAQATWQQALGEPLDHLFGWASLAQFDLLDSDRGAADPLGEVLLGQVEGRAPLLQSDAE
jgi:hypothetical protein